MPLCFLLSYGDKPVTVSPTKCLNALFFAVGCPSFPRWHKLNYNGIIAYENPELLNPLELNPYPNA